MFTSLKFALFTGALALSALFASSASAKDGGCGCTCCEKCACAETCKCKDGSCECKDNKCGCKGGACSAKQAEKHDEKHAAKHDCCKK